MFIVITLPAVAEEQLREREAGLRLSDAGGACEQEETPSGRSGDMSPAVEALHGARDLCAAPRPAP